MVFGVAGNKSLKMSPYRATLTREQFLFYEMRTTARLIDEGLEDGAVIDRIVRENLFQYPTERSLRSNARSCIKRLRAMSDDSLITAISTLTSDHAKQICLYAMMKQHRVVWDFMITVIGEKYRLRDFRYGRLDVNVFFLRLQEQHDDVAAWSESTITKIKQVLTRVLIENGYLDDFRSTQLNPVLLCSTLEQSIRCNHDEAALPAFNCMY